MKQYETPWIEISTHIPCCNSCAYCPQKTLIESYRGKSNLDLEDFKTLLKNIPKSVIISFAAFNEPFQNPECADMMLYAHEQGYYVAVWTTLVGLKEEDIEKIKDIPFIKFSVHDITGRKLDLPFVSDYHKVSNVISRAGNLFQVKRKDKVSGCRRGPYNHNILLPNGDVCLCCNDWGIKHILGNLFVDHYNNLNRKGPFELCHSCEYAF